MLQADAATSRFQGYWPSSTPAPARTRVRGSDEALEAASGSSWSSTWRTPSGSTCTYGRTASGRQKVTNLRLPGQYDERLFATAGISGLQGPYYNWNRWYLPSIGRYMELDPVALEGAFDAPFGPDWYGYALQNPLRYIDPQGREAVCIAAAGGGAALGSAALAAAAGVAVVGGLICLAIDECRDKVSCAAQFLKDVLLCASPSKTANQDPADPERCLRWARAKYQMCNKAGGNPVINGGN